MSISSPRRDPISVPSDEYMFNQFEDLIDKKDEESLLSMYFSNKNHRNNHQKAMDHSSFGIINDNNTGEDSNEARKNNTLDIDDDILIVPKLDASALTLNDLLHEMEQRGLQPRGFFDDDAKLLQEELDKEYESYVESKRRETREAEELEAQQAIIQVKKMLMEAHIEEERLQYEKDAKFRGALEMVKKNLGNRHIRIDVNMISVRSLAKALWRKDSHLLSLDLSNMNLSDLSGAYICRALRNNRSLIKLELGGNYCGIKTCTALGDALMTNNVVKFVSLESNPLVIIDKASKNITSSGNNTTVVSINNPNDIDANKSGSPGDQSDSATIHPETEKVTKHSLVGIKAIADMLKVNETLTHLSLWRCGINSEGCKMLADAFTSNNSLTYFDLPYNDWDLDQIQSIIQRLDINTAKKEEIEEKQRQLREEKEKFLREEEEARLLEQKQVEEEKWLEDQKTKRQEARRIRSEYEAKVRAEEEEKEARKEDARLQAEKAAADAEKKKVKKSKKKKKK